MARMPKVCVEACVVLNSNALARQNAFRGGGMKQVVVDGLEIQRAVYWSGSGAAGGRLELTYRVGDRNRTSIIRVQKRQCYFGGYRYRWLCPACSGRCERVYLPPGEVGLRCRTCWGLGYASQR